MYSSLEHNEEVHSHFKAKILVENYRAIILPLKWLFSTSLGPKAQFSLFIFPSILLLTVEDLSNTGGNVIKNHIPTAPSIFYNGISSVYGATQATTILILLILLYDIY